VGDAESGEAGINGAAKDSRGGAAADDEPGGEARVERVANGDVKEARGEGGDLRREVVSEISAMTWPVPRSAAETWAELSRVVRWVATAASREAGPV
jgi:hypothetical protein